MTFERYAFVTIFTGVLFFLLMFVSMPLALAYGIGLFIAQLSFAIWITLR